MEKYDTIIIGAGPAGLKCAETLGDSKLKVAIIEQKKIVGPKACAGGLTILNNPFKIPHKKCLIFKEQRILLNNKMYKIRLYHPLHTISRQDLGRYQLDIIRGYKNINIKINTEIKKINNSHILTKDGKRLYFKNLVGADGSNSIVRKFLGLKNKIYMGIHYKISKRYDKLIWFFNPKLLKSGYGWIFPNKNFTSAGVYFNPKIVSLKEAKKSLENLLKTYGIDYNKAEFEGSFTNCLFKGIKFGNIFLIGDAAGTTSANTGEGISYAMAAGVDVGRHILDKSYEFDNIKKLLNLKEDKNLFYESLI